MKQSKQQHFAALAETSAAVWPVVEARAFAGMPESLRSAVRPSMERCLARRRSGPLLRPLLARMCFEVTSGVGWRKQLPLLAVVELLNISTYQSNYCFDEKAGVETSTERNNQFICSMLTMSSAIADITGSLAYSERVKSKVAELLARSNHEVYQGQYIDLNLLNLDKSCDYPDEESFLQHYARRCDLIAGSTFRACACGAIPNDPPSEVLDAVIAYLGALGSAAQAVNDLGDYIPLVTKDYAAPFSDLVLGRFTFPLFLLKRAGFPIDEWREAMRRPDHQPATEKEIVDAILDLKIETKVRRLVRSTFFPVIRANLAFLERKVGRERVAQFRFAYPYIFNSRLLRHFRSGLWKQPEE